MVVTESKKVTIIHVFNKTVFVYFFNRTALSFQRETAISESAGILGKAKYMLE